MAGGEEREENTDKSVSPKSILESKTGTFPQLWILRDNPFPQRSGAQSTQLSKRSPGPETMGLSSLPETPPWLTLPLSPLPGGGSCHFAKEN